MLKRMKFADKEIREGCQEHVVPFQNVSLSNSLGNQ